ncbi:MAG TPA: glycosyltransferase [Burkholderiales bacterium]|jgi:glycosyltransferase involved in cell wall biosynthesis|nr:glycosyltransferase [Burkholderiales bacterium]
MRVMLVDPSLYTGPYDAGLNRGLVEAHVQPVWITRPVRQGDRVEIPPERAEALFYRQTDQATWLPPSLRALAKGLAHAAGLARLVWKVWRQRPDVLHIQWVVVPLLDVIAMSIMRHWCPLVLTVHDSVAYNGQKMPWLQRQAHWLPARLAHHIIVHTHGARENMCTHGIARERISVIPHGPLDLPAAPPPAAARDSRWTIVLFGEIKPYKGLDVLIDAVGALPQPVRSRLRIIVAGRPRMDLTPLTRRIEARGLARDFDLRLRRLNEAEMSALFAEADAFVFPYRQVDASGVYYLVKSLGKWLIASRVGVFAEEITAAQGTLVPPGDAFALASALRFAAENRPRGSAAAADDKKSWLAIGRATRRLYERLALGFA